MTQPSTSNEGSFFAKLKTAVHEPIDSSAKGSSNRLNNSQAVVLHPNFDSTQIPLDPARSLNDIPEPARQNNAQLRQLYGNTAVYFQSNDAFLSKWQLMASEPFAQHLALLRAAQLLALPASFYQRPNKNKPPLLSALAQMTLLDLSDIQAILQQYPSLTRYGFGVDTDTHQCPKLKTQNKHHNPDELLNSSYADDWHVILQPQHFEMGMGSLATDIMACSVAVHALKQCATRKSINHRYSAEQICQYVRSYVLSQVSLVPSQQYHYRQIRLFTGHILIAAAHLGWDLQRRDDGKCYVNVSSRCGLLTRYANMQDYHINGWSS